MLEARRSEIRSATDSQISADRFMQNRYAAEAISDMGVGQRRKSGVEKERQAGGRKPKKFLPVLRAIMVGRSACSRKFLATVNLSYPAVAPVLLREPGLGPQC